MSPIADTFNYPELLAYHIGMNIIRAKHARRDARHWTRLKDETTAAACRGSALIYIGMARESYKKLLEVKGLIEKRPAPSSFMARIAA